MASPRSTMLTLSVDAEGNKVLKSGILTNVRVAADVRANSLLVTAPAESMGLIAAFVGWLVWSGITYLIGDKLLGGTATWGELLRTIGFAQSPGMLYVLAIVPLVGGLVRLVVLAWLLVAGIIAIRQALDFSTDKAILTALLGWLVMGLLSVPLLAHGPAG